MSGCSVTQSASITQKKVSCWPLKRHMSTSSHHAVILCRSRALKAATASQVGVCGLLGSGGLAVFLASTVIPQYYVISVDIWYVKPLCTYNFTEVSWRKITRHQKETQSYSWSRPPPGGEEKIHYLQSVTDACILNWKNRLLDDAKVRAPNDPQKENTHIQKNKHKHTLFDGFFFPLTFGLSSRICWRMSLCFSSSLSCLLLCASSNFTHRHAHRHTRTISGWCKHLQVETNDIFPMKWRDGEDLSSLVWCTEPPRWQMSGWSPACLCGGMVFPVRAEALFFKWVCPDT